MRENIQELWESEIWPQVSNLANSLEVTLMPPRRTSRQVYRRNTGGDAKEYFKGDAIDMLDQVISDLERRFGEDQKTTAKLLFLHPDQLRQMEFDAIKEELKDVVNHFNMVNRFLSK